MAANKRNLLMTTPMSRYCDQYLISQHGLTEADRQKVRKAWDMGVAKFISLMQETGEAGLTEKETLLVVQMHKDEVLDRILGNKYGNVVG